MSPRRKSNSNSGYILIDLLAALALLSVSWIGVVRGLSGSFRLVSRQNERILEKRLNDEGESGEIPKVKTVYSAEDFEPGDDLH